MPLMSKNLEVPTVSWLICELSRIIKRPRSVVLTRITLPIEVLFGVAVTSQINPGLLPSRAMREWNMPVCNVVEEMDFTLIKE